MNSSNKTSVVVASLVGSVLVHGVLTACSGGSPSMALNGNTPAAHADVPAATPACTKWKVKSVVPPSIKFVTVQELDSTGKPDQIAIPSFDEFEVPEGWEPFAADHFGAVTLRTCIARQ